MLPDLLMPYIRMLENYTAPSPAQEAVAFARGERATNPAHEPYQQAPSPAQDAEARAREADTRMRRSVEEMDRLQTTLVHWWWCFAKVGCGNAGVGSLVLTYNCL